MTLASKVSYNELCTFVETYYDAKNPSDTMDPSACWCCAQYIRHLLGHNIDAESSDAHPIELKSPLEILNWKGIHHCFQECKGEMHYFTIEIEDDNCTIINTYGGIDKIFISTHKTKSWINLYTKAIKGDIKAYNRCFGIVAKKDLDISGLVMHHT